ncbi:TonB-dependent receptor plug domain-containing protein [Azospirillum halopraeferens]|uniref:TonB-dependent receptor plug domain-containing protein n=1 Tax=Azospirillum halopraeferens TaxID=34010 RepID=UPI0003F8D97E|nr:TonB-dependent receptor [Azospirillum halopraeferens]
MTVPVRFPRPVARARLTIAALLAGTAFGALTAPARADEALLLPPVSVTANRTATPAAEVGSALTIITGDALERRQTRVVSDILREVPGLAVNRTGPMGGTTQVRIRGAEGNQTLVIVDGIEMNDPSAGSEYDFANLLAGDIERIEVLRGPQSALYGSDALGGVIAVTTRRGDGAPGLSAAVEGGSFGTRAGHAAAGMGTERFDARVSVQGVTTRGTSVADRRLGNTEADGHRNGTVSARFGVRPTDTTEITATGRFTRFRTDTDGFIGGAGAVDADQDTVGRQAFGRIQGRALFLDGRWEHVAGVSVSDHDRDYREAGRVTGHYEGRKTRLDYQTSLTVTTEPAEHVFTAGIEREADKAVSTSVWSFFDRSIASTGLVGQYRLGLFERLYLSGSVRHDRNDLFDDATTWRATAAYTVEGPETKLRASYGTGVKNPTLFELYGYTATYRGNPDLRPEKGTGWDVGIDQPLWGGRAVVDATYFRQRITDLITGTGASSANMPGDSRIDGVELGVSVRPLDGVTLRAAYTFTDGEDATGARLLRRPRHLASLNVGYRFAGDRADVNLGVVYNGPQTDWAFDAAYNRTVVDLSAYTLVNLAASYRLTDTVTVFGRVENLLDREYQEVWTYGTPGRAGYVGLRFSL